MPLVVIILPGGDILAVVEAQGMQLADTITGPGMRQEQ